MIALLMPVLDGCKEAANGRIETRAMLAIHAIEDILCSDADAESLAIIAASLRQAVDTL